MVPGSGPSPGTGAGRAGFGAKTPIAATAMMVAAAVSAAVRSAGWGIVRVGPMGLSEVLAWGARRILSDRPARINGWLRSRDFRRLYRGDGARPQWRVSI